MPTHFGPALGPRQGIAGRRYECSETPHQQIVRAGFRADAARLAQFLPPRFTLRRGAIHLTFAYMSGIEWLAGRGYNTFGVSVPARYAGQGAPVDGEFLLVLWENFADAITSGREELGFAKVYCELPPAQQFEHDVTCRASWDGCEFAALRLSGVGHDAARPVDDTEPSAGLLHYKYIPRTGAPGTADAEYAVLTPAEGGHLRIERQLHARAAHCTFRHSSWEELPTLVNIVNALAGVEFGECIEATMLWTRGAKDLGDQRILP